MKDFMMNTFSDVGSNIKDKIDENLLQDIKKSYPQDYEQNVDNFSVKGEKKTTFKSLYQSWDKFDAYIEKNFEKPKEEIHKDIACKKNEENQIVDSIDMPKQKDIIRHFESNLQKYSSKCDVTQEELEEQKIPSGILQYLYSIFSKIGKRMFRKILILMYSFKEIDIKDKVLILSALGYLISPIDMIPDTLLGVGFADDAVVISYIFNKIIIGVSEQTIKKVDTLLSLLEKGKLQKDSTDLDNVAEDKLNEDIFSKENEDISNSVNHLNFFKR